MRQATWKLRLWIQLVTVTILGVVHRTAWGQTEPIVAPTAEDVEKNAVGIVDKVTAAFNGNEAAQSDLIAMAGNATFVLAMLFIAYIVASSVGRWIGGIVSKKVDLTLGKFLSKAVRNVIMLFVAMIALQRVGFDVTSLAAVLAAAGFAVGMALQGTMQNFAAGIMLLLFRPFKVDDYIMVAGTEGTVEEIDLFTTRLNALDNRHLIIPNGEIFGAKLENFTRNALRRVDVNVGAGYNADLDETRQALERAAEAVNKAFIASAGNVNVPDPQVYLKELGASSVDWQLRVWCRPEDFWGVREALTGAAKDSLDQSGISIPYPQLDVHVVGKVLAKAAAA